MEKLELKFVAPRVLDELREAKPLDKEQWFYNADKTMPLSLDIENWQICCEANNINAHITEWRVNQDSNAMVVDNEESDYEKISFPFSAAMLGQIVRKEDLIRFLGELQEAFEIANEDTSQDSDGTDNNNDKND